QTCSRPGGRFVAGRSAMGRGSIAYLGSQTDESADLWTCGSNLLSSDRAGPGDAAPGRRSLVEVTEVNPFDLTGPEFLIFYLGLAAVVIGVQFLWRRQSESRNALKIDLADPYLIASLRGGDNEVIRV